MKKEFSYLSLTSFTSKILAIFLTLFAQFLFGQDSTGTMTDIDGNVYKTLKISTQWWMAENLIVTHYRNRDPIQNVTSAETWENLTTSAYCNYANDEEKVKTYGRLYNWYAVNDSRGLAPEGWHVPSDEEWKQLEMYLGMSQSEADHVVFRSTNVGSKLAGNASLWENSNLENNLEFSTSGFSALPGGYRSEHGSYRNLGYYANFWSSTEVHRAFAWRRLLYYTDSDVHRDTCNKRYGFSVRCVRD